MRISPLEPPHLSRARLKLRLTRSVPASGRRLNPLDVNCVVLLIENTGDQHRFAVILFRGLLVIEKISVARSKILEHILSVALGNLSGIGLHPARICRLRRFPSLLSAVEIARPGIVGQKQGLRRKQKSHQHKSNLNRASEFHLSPRTLIARPGRANSGSRWCPDNEEQTEFHLRR